MTGRGFVFHLPGSALRDPAKMKPFYRALMDGLAARGHRIATCVHDRARVAAQVAADDDLHIVDHGQVRHPRVWNAGIAYVYPFWNLDPWGIRALSSIRARSFDPAAIDPAEAAAFAGRLRGRLVGKRRSRYGQPEAMTDIPAGCIAVFLQAERHRTTAETCHLSLRQMVKAVIARDDPRPIVIKPHPLDDDPATMRFLNRIAADPRVLVTPANIHDILARADAVVTINSAVGIEAMLHRRPVVLCGQSDFHHAAVTVTRRADLDRAIARAEATDWPHDAFLTWYFRDNCVKADSPTLVDDVLRRLRAPVDEVEQSLGTVSEI